MGSILGCRQAALAMAAGMTLGRSAFLRVDMPRSRRNESEEDAIARMKAERVLKERQLLSVEVGKSDHALLAAAFMKWLDASSSGNSRKQVCDSLGLSFPAMREMLQLKNQLEGSLSSLGYVSNAATESNSSSWRIIRACAVAALSPGQLVKVVRPAIKYDSTAEGAVERDGKAKELKLYVRVDNPSNDSGVTPGVGGNSKEERVFIHPSSTCFNAGSYSCPWLVYHTLMRTSQPFLRDVTECNVYPLLLMGGGLDVKASDHTITIDQWCTLRANARIGSLMGAMRQRMDDLLREKIQNPSMELASTSIMKMIVKLIVSDGLPISKTPNSTATKG
jgi:ATP-dependent RNA helicase DHX57